MLDIIFFSYSIRWNSPTCSLPQTKKPHPYDFLKSIQNFQPPFQRIAQPSTPSLQGTSLSPCLSLRVLAEAPFSFLQGTMEVRVGLLFVLVLGASWACDARQLGNTKLYSGNGRIFEISVMQINYQDQDSKVQTMIEVSRNDNVCTLCEEFANQALDYLAENKTQTEVIVILHQTCSRIGSFQGECITLVDYYAPLFFLEVSSVQPEEFCRKVNLCKQIAMISSQLHEDSCGLCHRTVSELLVKLKDPDTQLEIIELLLKACNSMENYAKKCKKMVFEYGPLILANAEKFLETTDICITLHACNSSTGSSTEASPVAKVPALSSS